jgi:hypothetical protein
MQKIVRRVHRAFAIGLCVGTVSVYPSGVFGEQPPLCMSVRECAQKSAEAALAAKAAAESAALHDLLPKIRPATGLNMKCNSYYSIQPAPNQDRWENAQTEVKCEANEVRVSGGCAFTCLDLAHTVSVPTDNNGWKCGAISNDPQRSFHAVALCMRFGGAP